MSKIKSKRVILWWSKEVCIKEEKEEQSNGQKINEKEESLKLDMQLERHNLSYKRQCIDVRVCAKNREAPSTS
mgnify:CR=1 FL=1